MEQMEVGLTYSADDIKNCLSGCSNVFVIFFVNPNTCLRRGN
jgi:hypothetical protein